MVDYERFLLQMGVSLGYIDRMKREACTTSSEFHLFYEMVWKPEYHVQVPVEKIIGLTGSRGKDGASWWDHFTGKAGFIVRDRIEYLRGRLEEMGLERFREHFSDKRYPVDLGYYPEHDVYIVEHDGNHRTLWAKIVGAPVICATVHPFRFLPDHYERHKPVKERKKQFDRILELYHLRWEEADHEIFYKDIPVERFDPGYHNRKNYEDDSGTNWIHHQFDKMEEKIHRVGKIHRAMGWITNQRIRDGILDLILREGLIHEDSAWKMLKNLYQAGWPGVK